MRRKHFLVCAILLICCKCGASFTDVTEAALEELGSTYGMPQMNGFVFIEGRYVSPPYTVTRKGNGIFINRIQVEQVAYATGNAMIGTAGPAPSARGERSQVKKLLDADGDFEEVAAVAGPAPAAPAVEPVAEPDKPKAVNSIDDLFADEDPSGQAPAAPAPTVPASAVSAPMTPNAAAETPEVTTHEKETVIAKLDRIRKGYEEALSRGDLFFFGQRHNRVNGNYGTARTLMRVLPKALRYAESPNDLFQRLTQGGVYFIDLGICAELFINKTTFPQLEERLRKIEQAEALEALKRRSGNAW